MSASLLLLPAMAAAQFVPLARAPSPRGPLLHPAAGTGDPVAAREMRDVRRRIDDGRASGQLSRREARDLRRETRAVETMALRYGRDGMSAAEARELAVRNRVLHDQVVARRSGFRPPPPLPRPDQRGR